MARYALLLRGVNVGTKNALPMAELKAMLTKLGCTGVMTYVQSGNAVFDTKRAEPALTRGIEAALAKYMGRPIDTTLRTHDELAAIVKRQPFGKVASEPRFLCVTFLSHAPTKAELAPLLAKDWSPDLLHVSGRELYSWHPNGQGKSPLAAALTRLKLQGAVTTRNWNTVLKLEALLADGSAAD